jgi:hypothetical protein
VRNVKIGRPESIGIDMPCSDTLAEILEARDPEFKTRNEWNQQASQAEYTNALALCEMGIAAYSGKKIPELNFCRVEWPSGNPWLARDLVFARAIEAEAGLPISMRKDERVNRIADAADSLLAWEAGCGNGKLAFEWLIYHWTRDLQRLNIDNERHQNEMKIMEAKGRTTTANYMKRVARVATDVPAADEKRKQVQWAQAMLADRWVP